MKMLGGGETKQEAGGETSCYQQMFLWQGNIHIPVFALLPDKVIVDCLFVLYKVAAFCGQFFFPPDLLNPACASWPSCLTDFTNRERPFNQITGSTILVFLNRPHFQGDRYHDVDRP